MGHRWLPGSLLLLCSLFLLSGSSKGGILSQLEKKQCINKTYIRKQLVQKSVRFLIFETFWEQVKGMDLQLLLFHFPFARAIRNQRKWATGGCQGVYYCCPISYCFLQCLCSFCSSCSFTTVSVVSLQLLQYRQFLCSYCSHRTFSAITVVTVASLESLEFFCYSIFILN